MLFSLKRRRLCHTVLAALRGAYGFAPAQAAISIAAKTARVPHGQRHHVSAAGSLARSCGCAARRPRSARHCFRDLLMTLDRLCRYSLPLAFCAENAALALRAPQDAALPCGGGASFHGSLRSRLRRPRSCSTLFYTKARPESILTRRGLCRTTPLNTALFRAGAFQLRSGPPQTVPGLPAFRLRGRFRGWRARIRFPFVPAGSPGMRLPS